MTTTTPVACPFCGATENAHDQECGRHWIYCGECDAQGPYADSPELAAIAWDKRDGQMTEALARGILGSVLVDDQLPSGFFSDPPDQRPDDSEADGRQVARLDGRFTSDHLDAIAWWMQNKQKDR